jgi:hypothetical protein
MNLQNIYVICQLYAGLHEWRGGEHWVIGFSANMFLDVYLGHINTLKSIKEKNGMAFHSMMMDIYAQARYVVEYTSLYFLG